MSDSGDVERSKRLDDVADAALPQSIQAHLRTGFGRTIGYRRSIDSVHRARTESVRRSQQLLAATRVLVRLTVVLVILTAALIVITTLQLVGVLD